MIERLDVESLSCEDVAKTIDHSLLRPTLTEQDLRKGCKLADRYHTKSVCVKPYHVKLASGLLSNSDVKVSTVIGFPHGGHLTRTKELETEQALADGAHELDMVINVGALKSGDYEFVEEDIRGVVVVARRQAGILVKAILENCFLSEDEKIVACRLAEAAGADYVKTSTGFGGSGATVHDVELMYNTVGPRLGVKAAGGIRSLEAALAVIRAGATRIGATQTETIMEGWIASHPGKT